MAFFSTPAYNKSFDKISEQNNNGMTTVKYKKGKQNITATFNEPSETALKRFANTFNDIISNIANKESVSLKKAGVFCC